MLTCLLCLAWIYVFMRFLSCFKFRSTSVHVYMLGFMFFHVYVLSFYMFTCMFLCIYAQINVFTCLCAWIYALLALCYLPCACALHAIFVCLNLGYVCHAMCYCSPFVPFITFSCVLAHQLGPDLDLVVFVIVCIPQPISKGLDAPILLVYARLLPCFMLVLASLVLGFATLDDLRGFVVVWLHSMTMRPHLGVATWDASSDAKSLRTCPSLSCSV